MNKTDILISILYRTARFFCGQMEKELRCGQEKDRTEKAITGTAPISAPDALPEESTALEQAAPLPSLSMQKLVERTSAFIAADQSLASLKI